MSAIYLGLNVLTVDAKWYILEEIVCDVSAILVLVITYIYMYMYVYIYII